MDEEEDPLSNMDGWGYNFLEDYHFFEGCSYYLREIELQLNENIDFNKDKYKIQSVFKKFEDFHENLVFRHEFNEVCIKDFYKKLRSTKLNDDEKFHYKCLIQKYKKNVAFAFQIIKRKKQVEDMLKELGMKLFCFIK